MNNAHKGAFNYFDAYEKQAQYAQEMILNLSSALRGGELGSRELMISLHTVENDADAINHAIQDQLLADFVVPMERGSMASLAHALDDVCDTVEQVAIDAYVRKFEVHKGEAPSDIAELAALLEETSVSLASAVTEMRGFNKNHKKIKRHCIAVQNCESKADEIYINSVRALYEDASLDDRTCRIRHDLLNTIEKAMDSLENAAERIESIITENV